MMKSIWWFITKWTAVLLVWVLSMVLAIGSTFLMNNIGNLRGMLPSLPLSVLELKDAEIKKRGVELKAEKAKGQKVKNKIKINAERSRKRTMAAAKRLPAEELADLLGPLGLAAGAGFVAYDLTDICWELHDQNELLELIGAPLLDNPFVDGCDKVAIKTDIWVIKAKDGWNYIATKTQNGWDRAKIKVGDWGEALKLMQEIATDRLADQVLKYDYLF
ncbi:hypothetical protein OAO91_05695 [Luminiphilus sp.]|nr:hypothetical protein [Luminiphilus sp.]